jgi:L-aminopeptidase/D-esterase-like protein
MVVNALGDPLGELSDAAYGDGHSALALGRRPRVWDPAQAPSGVESTTIGIIVTNAKLDKLYCHKVAESGHDGLARALDPVHTAADGDALVVAATGDVDATLPVLQSLGAWVAEQAVADAVGRGR